MSTNSNVTTEEVAARLGDPNTTIIDVRTHEKYRTAHVPGARHIPIDQIRREAPDLPRDHLIITYCGGGSSGPAAAEILREHGYDAVVMSGGMRAWQRESRPVATGDAPE